MKNTNLNLNPIELFIKEGIKREIVTPAWAKNARALFNYIDSAYFERKLRRAATGNRAALYHLNECMRSKRQAFDVLENVALSKD